MDERLLQTNSLKQIIDRLFPITSSSLKGTLQTLKARRNLSFKEIADLILFLADTSHRSWNIPLILTSINETFENINWRAVYERFLDTDLKIWNSEYLYTLVDCWICISGIITIPYEIFFKKWENRENQIEFFKILLESDHNKTQIYSNMFFTKLVSREVIKKGKGKDVDFESNYNCAELYDALKEINAVEIIEYIRIKLPEYCILGLAHCYPFCEEIFDELLISECQGPTSQFVFNILLTKHIDFIFHKFKAIKATVPLTKILDIFLEHKVLPILTGIIDPMDLCFDIVILSFRRDHLNLEIWLSNLGKESDLKSRQKLKSFLKYLQEKGFSTDISPLNKDTIGTIFKALSTLKNLEIEEVETINKIKSAFSEETNFSNRATIFITEVINSNSEFEGYLTRLEAAINTKNEEDILFVKQVFTLLIDNYSSLNKLPNSDTIALFFGELIKRKMLKKPFLRVSLILIKESLLYPETEREYSFAMKILEVFFNYLPEFYVEISENEKTVQNLIKNDYLIVDEDNQRLILLKDMLVNVLGIKEDISNITIDVIKESVVRNSIKTSNFHLKMSKENKKLSNNQLALFIYLNLLGTDFLSINKSSDLQTLFFNCVCAQGDNFIETFVGMGINVLKSFLIYKAEDEIKYIEALGNLLGSLTIEINKPIVLNVFDFNAFIMKSIEYRRTLLCIHFLFSYLKRGSFIFKPENPWLMNILENLTEIYVFCLSDVRKMIENIFSYFNLEIKFKGPTAITRTKLRKNCFIKYNIEYNGILRQVISTSLDFSVREICNKIIKACLTVTSSTAIRLFLHYKSKNFRTMRVKVSEEANFVMFKNLFINLSKSLIHISAQEPLKASMCGNISHFLKLSSLEISLEGISEIIENNIRVCCLIIEKAGVTMANEMSLSLYTTHIDKVFTHRSNLNTVNLSSMESLKILTEPCVYEKTIIKSIESVEYQEIKSFLLQIGKKVKQNIVGPLKDLKISANEEKEKNSTFEEEWDTLTANILSNEIPLKTRTSNFAKMIKYLSESLEKDEQSLGLCKYLIGHALSKEIKCKDSYIFEFIHRIFEISLKTKQEVVGWLIYSEDPKKFNVPLIKRFIECDFICVEEYDQSLSKLLKTEDSSERCLDFTLSLLSALILDEIRYCTVYDFIYTIEVLNKINENVKVFEFFKKVENGMMRFVETSSEPCCFDLFVKSCRFTVPPSQFLGLFADRTLNFKTAFKSCWLHFVLYPGSYRYFKIDILVSLCRADIYLYLKESLKFFVQAYQKRNYLFFYFYCRFIIKILDFIDDSVESRGMIWKLLEVLITVPGFICQFLEILDHKYIVKYFERPEFFFISKQILEILEANKNLEPLVVEFFTKNISYFRKQSSYLNLICPYWLTGLKNLFNQTKIRENCNKKLNYTELIDSLGENNTYLQSNLEGLKYLLDRKLFF